MTRVKIWCGVALLLALLVIGGAIASNSAGASSISHKKPPITPQPAESGAAQTNVSGVPAIPVHTSLGATANTASTAAFTQDDVIAFLNEHGFYAGPLAPGAHLKILTIQFVTAKQASNLMHGESVGVPDDYLVCYVKVQGPFLLQNVELPPGAKETTADVGDVVFDAHTGNMLVWGVY